MILLLELSPQSSFLPFGLMLKERSAKKKKEKMAKFETDATMSEKNKLPPLINEGNEGILLLRLIKGEVTNGTDS